MKTQKKSERPRLLHGAAFCMLLMLPMAASAASFQVYPASLTITPTEKNGLFTVENTTNEKLTVQMRVMSWKQNEKGDDAYEPAKDIIFYPQIVSIEKGKTQIIRVGYDGAPPAGQETLYRLFVRELPVRTPGETALKMALQLALPIFVAPVNAQEKLVLEGIAVEDGMTWVRIRNSGTSHAMIPRINVWGLDEAGATVFSRDEPGWYILPGILKRFAIQTTPEERDKVSILRAGIGEGNLHQEVNFALDDSSRALLKEGDEKRKAENQGPNLPGK